MGNKKIKYSGFPKDLVTDEQKLAYCKEVNEAMNFNSEDLRLNLENVKLNTVQRDINKTGLNSLLGKMSQGIKFNVKRKGHMQNKVNIFLDPNLPRKLLINSQDELDRVLHEASHDIFEILTINQQIVQVQVRKKEGYERISRRTNVVKISAFAIYIYI